MKKLIYILTFSLFVISSVCAQWVQTNGPTGGIINCLAASNTNIFCGTDSNGVYVSSDNGLSWNPTNNGLTKYNIRKLTTSGSKVYAGTGDGGIFISTNNGVNWVNRGFNSQSVMAILVSNDTIYAATIGNGISISTNNGVTWSLNVLPGTDVRAMVFYGSEIWAAGTSISGIVKSSNGGVNWVSAGLTNTNVNSLCLSTTGMLAGTPSGLMRTTNGGTNWNLIYSGGGSVGLMSTFGNTIIACTGPENLSLSTNNGSTWTDIGCNGYSVNSIIIKNGTQIFIGTIGGIFNSTNNGSTWNTANEGMKLSFIYSFGYSGPILYAGTAGGIYSTSNNGINWSYISNGIIGSKIVSIISAGIYIYAATPSRVYRSSNSGVNWSGVYSGSGNITGLIKYNYVSNMILVGASDGVYKSTDYGNNWSQVSIGLTDNNILYLYSSDYSVYYYCVTPSGVFSGDGYSWVNKGTPGFSVSDMTYFGGELYACGGSQIKKNSVGMAWTAVPCPLNQGLSSFELNGNNLYLSTSIGIVYLSTNSGNNWTVVGTGLPNKRIWRLKFFNGYLFAGTFGSSIWNNSTLIIPESPALINPINNSNIPTLTPTLDWNDVLRFTSYNVQVATDTNYINLVVNQSGLTTSQYSVPSGVLTGNTVYYWRARAVNEAGLGPWSVRWNFIVNPTGIVQYSSEIPKEFKLHNNYPNPFNPSTKIRFDIPKNSNVKISVYDISGRLINQLLNEHINAGSYETTWNADNFASGVYFYRIEAGSFTDTKRMLLVK